jgi:hypothetical protein
VSKSSFLQIRLSPEDRKRMDAIAGKAYLETSTWARQVLLKALEESEPSPPTRTQNRNDA